MKLIIKTASKLSSQAPALQIRGSEEWERAGMAEAAFHLIDNEDDRVNLRRAALSGRALTIGDIELRIIKLHSNEGGMTYSDHLAIYKVIKIDDVVIEVADEKEALQKCKELSVIKDSDGNIRATHGVTYQISSKRSRWFGDHIERCGTHNHFTEEAINESVPVIATFESGALFGILIN